MPDYTEGRFFCLVGPSGVGKDSLIDAARTAIREKNTVRFVRRTITRPSDAGGEAHEAVSAEVFQNRVNAGAFALHWQAHGLSYGVPKDIDETLQSGVSVSVNLSRTVIPQVRARYMNRRIITISASPVILAQRLAARGRETPEEIERRLQRAYEDIPVGEDVVMILNDGSLQDAAQKLIEILTSR